MDNCMSWQPEVETIGSKGVFNTNATRHGRSAMNLRRILGNRIFTALAITRTVLDAGSG